MKRPLVNACRSLAVAASVIGLRENATAIPVPRSTSDVVPAANRSGKNGSWFVSAVQMPLYPAASCSAACAANVPRSCERSGPSPPSTFIASAPW